MPAKKPASNPNKVTNISGKGGFSDHPENRHRGGFSPEHSVSFNYRKFLSLPEEEFNLWLKLNPDRTLAQTIAHKAAGKARNDLSYLKELTDRTEGRAPVAVDVTSQGKDLSVSFISIEQ